MSEIDRYDPWAEIDGDQAYPVMERHPEGDWIKFEDHQQMIATLPAKEVTDEMVERACKAFGGIRPSNWFGREQMRAALISALTNDGATS